MKSARNPPSKQLPAARRKKSDVQPSGENVSTNSMEDMSTQPVSAVDEGSQTSHVEEKSAISCDTPVCQPIGDIPESVLQVRQKVVPFASSNVPRSFQSEFLKMLTQTKRRRCETSQHRPKQQKVNESLVRKSKKTSGHHPAVLQQKSAATPAESQCFISAATSTSSSEQSTTLMQEVENTDNYLKHSMQSATDATGQTSSLICSSETVSSAESLDSERVSSESGQVVVVADVSQSLEKPDRLSCTSSTCTLCEGVKHDDDQLSTQDDSRSSTQTDVSPPHLSLPDPEIDVDIGPPMLEPYDGVTFEYSSAGVQTVSDAVSVDVSVTSSTCWQTNLVKISEHTDNELRTDQQCHLAHNAGMSSADVVDVTDSSVSVSVTCSNDSPTVCSASVDSELLNSSAEAMHAQQRRQVDCSSTDYQPTSSFRYSALARFRPTFSATSLLPPTSFSNRVPQNIRPNLVQNLQTGHSSSVQR